jgi:alkaline phosphatase D
VSSADDRIDTATTTGRGLGRRDVFRTGAFGALGAAALWGLGDGRAAAAPAHDGSFGYGVASGDPTADSVIIWTRFTPRVDGEPALPGSGRGAPTTVRWTVSPTPECTEAVVSGEVTTSPDSDHVVKVDVTGLDPYTEYFYVFTAGDETSEVGRTRTAPDEPGTTHALRFAQVSCSNWTGGHFGTYRAIAERDDLDFVLHLGDYFYEYGNGDDRYGPDELVGERDHEPAHERVTLADYRMRLAQYRTDPHLREAHRVHPFITAFDDHEITNNAWSDGAENHDGSEGDYATRMSAAFQAYTEWLPIRVDPATTQDGTVFHRRFTYGDLADLSVVETRQHRSEQVGSFVLIGGPDTNEELNDPDRHIMDTAQMEWLQDGLTQPRRWHLVGNQVMVSPLAWPGQYMGEVQGSIMVNADAWDGYRADQTSLLTHMARQPAAAGDTVILTGDIHSCWVEDLVADPDAVLEAAVQDYPEAARTAAATATATPASNPTPAPAAREGSPIPPMIAEPVPVPQELSLATTPVPAGVEFVCPSVSSDGFYEIVRSVLQSPTISVGAVKVAEAVLGAINPHLRWMDGIGHGFILIDVTEERVQADYHLTAEPSSAQPDPRVDPAHRPTHHASFRTLAGSRVTSEASGPVGPRSDAPRRAECAPAPTGTPTATPTATEAPSPSGSPSPSASPTSTGTPGPTGSPTPTPSTPPKPSPSGSPSWPSTPPPEDPGPHRTPEPGPDGDLPRTGADTVGALGLGLAAVAGGLGLTFAARRRRAVLDEQASEGDDTD